MKKSEKEQIIADVRDKVSRAKGMFFTDFTGITVEQATELRREFRKSGIDYKVVKNTLARKALESVTGFDAVYKTLTGPTGIAFSYEDPVTPAKIIKKFYEKNEKISCKACVIDKQVYEGSKLDELSKLPSRGEIIASILGSIQAPVSGIVGSINAVMRDLVGVLDAIEKKKAA
ncbi:MAG TPA: 50S ribosomal protein L10 [Bacteroidota bacterium]|nr:50S ribosomal protein L10 [Bacteroidota bacterium]